MANRIYVVQDNETEEMGGRTWLVEAANPAQAIRHVVRQRYNARAATARDVAELMTKKVSLEMASPEEPVAQQELAPA